MTSPLEEPTIQALFEADPAQLADGDFDKLIDYYRAERGRWQQLEAQGKKPSKAKTPAPSLDDLFGV